MTGAAWEPEPPEPARPAADAAGPDSLGLEGLEVEPPAALAVFGSAQDVARRYVHALATDGVVRGLIGPREIGRLWSRHVLNCAVVSELVPAGARVVDIGSGAGLPGIPLAIARPDCRFDLVEPMQRRSQFLTEVTAELGLANCRVVRTRAEQAVADCGGADVVTARAVAPLGMLADWAAPLLRTGGLFLALKGSSADEEVRRDRPSVTAVGIVDLAVLQVGAGVLDPATTVIRGSRNGRVAVRSVRGKRSVQGKR